MLYKKYELSNPAVDPRFCGPLFHLLKVSLSRDKYRTGRNKRKPLGGVEGSCVITLPHLQSTGLPLQTKFSKGCIRNGCVTPHKGDKSNGGDVTFS
ncbi:hypothetical protein CEXT_468361 [Caerostris extrusa]|uniref:Uncharacterized protein n=1 Tax=Caerostris extrusa TaxID=172846 RepID=A0AAV4W0V0_CAEEX|nr:hypothetical protein CEXT_468361 [Caerostris extrusa]